MSSAEATRVLRIGELARRCATTPRTIRYYEELGLLGGGGATERRSGGHRSYTEADVAEVCELIRLRELLGLSLEELGRVIEAEDARALLRAEFEAGVTDPVRLREILLEALGHLDLQLSLVHRRQGELASLERELQERRDSVVGRLAQSRAGAPRAR
jgi:MerR family transcriptional regulator, repressor of the yfmOP operon